ncbi:MAG: phosphatase PAP2 family protein [Anaerolineae bacterium]
MDLWLFHLLNDQAGKVFLLDFIGQLLANDYLVLNTICLILVVLWLNGRQPQERYAKQQAILQCVLTLALVNIVAKALNLVYPRPRPFTFNEVNLLFYRPSDPSFPSNATAIAFGLATPVWSKDRPLGTIMYLLASLLGLARVYVGVQYPFDILGGALVGIFSALAVLRSSRRIQPLTDLIIRSMRKLYLA